MNGRRRSVLEITIISSWNGEKKRQKGQNRFSLDFRRRRERERKRVGLLIVDDVVGVAAAEI